MCVNKVHYGGIIVKAWIRLGMSGLTAAAVLLAGCSAAGSSGATDYPVKQITYVVPFSPGGGVDLVARAVAEYASKEWNQPIVVENKPGGGGAVGAQAVLQQSANDGYTILAINNSSTSMLSAGLMNPPVDIEDHRFVAKIVEDAPAFAVSATAPWNNFKEFSDWAKTNPGELTWTSVGPSGFSAFAVAEWMEAIGADMSKTQMVATKGASESAPLVAGGHAVLAVHTVAELYPLAAAGKIKILAVQSDKRSPYFPDVPTTAEQGVEGLSIKWWTGLSVPAGTPDAVTKKWEDLLAKMTQDPAFVDKLKGMQLEAAYQNSESFADTVNKETGYYTELAEKRGMRK